MGFRYPEFLFAWLLIAIPVIIHLFNFRKFKKVYFTNLQFLKQVQQETIAVHQLKERLILAARILAVFFLVLAFAQPYLKSKQNSNTFQQQIVSIYLDNSYSMEAVNKNGSLLDEGKRNVKEILNAYSLGDKFQLLTNNFEGSQQRLLNKDEVLEALEKVKITPFSRAEQAVINKQQSLLLSEQNVKRVGYFISDFQKTAAVKNKLKIDSSIQYYLIPLKANALPNVSVDSVYFLSPIHQPKEKESLVVVISNHADKTVDNIPIKLQINGVQKAIGNVSIKANAQQLDTLDFSGLNAGWQEAKLSIKDYPITFDDDLNFAFEVKKEVNVLALYENEAVQSIAYAYQTDAYFKFVAINQSEINYSNLNQQQLIVLENLKSISAGLTQQLKQYVQSGGSLSIFLPLNADLESYKTFCNTLNIDYPEALKNEIVKGKQLDLEHPIFNEVFDQIPKNLDLPIANSYFKSSNLTRTTKQVLLRGEGQIPLLNAYKINKGKVYLSLIPLEKEASNFVQHALFLPVLFKMALLGNQSQNLYYTLGNQQNINIQSVVLKENQIIKIKNNDVELIPELVKNPTETSLYFEDQLKKAGFYKVFLEKQLLAVFALNENRRESVLQFHNHDEIADLFQTKSSAILKTNHKPVAEQIKEVNLGDTLWKLCLILTLIFLAVEILLIRFYRNPNVKSKSY